MSANNLAFPIIKNTAEQITAICERIIFTAGPYLKEGIYQDILVHELRLKKFDPSREMVFNYKFVDSNGNDLIIGNSQYLRSDIELPSLKGILELKSSGASTKDDHIWQLRNYLEQRPDRNWGLVINFISKYDARSAPHVQCDLLVKSGKTYSLVTTNEESIVTNQYFSDRFYSKNYVELSNILVEFEDKDVESTNEKENTELESTIDKLEDNVYSREAEIIQIVRDNWLDWIHSELNEDEMVKRFENELQCL